MSEASAILTPGPAAAQADTGTFRFRLGRRGDIPHCLQMLPSPFRLEPSTRQRLPALWDQLYRSEAHAFAIIEDFSSSPPFTVEGFGLSAFVSDRFIDEFLASPQPHVSALFYERMLAGNDVLLTTEQIAEANATTGVNVLALHFGMRNEDFADARSQQVVAASGAASFYCHGGYRLRVVLMEVYGAEPLRFMKAGGFRLVQDFQATSPQTFAGRPATEYPYLLVLRREWLEPSTINPMSRLFFTPRPRIFFSAAERKVLERAVLNEPDRSIAVELGVSEAAIKKTWRNIFERVGRHASYLLPAGDLARESRRGQEKRRYLIEYMRTHLEELRPFKRPSM
jgi:hypothetical protein